MEKKIVITLTSKTGYRNQAEYLDEAKVNPQKPKAVIQIYNSDFQKTGLKYGELEIHSKPIKEINGFFITKEELTLEIKIKN